MNNRYLFIILFFFLTTLSAKETKEWQFQQFDIYFENDLFAQTDGQYSSGEKFSLLYYVPQSDFFVYDLFLDENKPSDKYISFALVNQIFTPNDISIKELIPDQRPYAGWTFLEAGFHKSSKDTLQSIYIQVGMVGPLSQAEDIQKFIHKVTGSEPPQGWDNQLKNEPGINLRYVYNWRVVHNFETIESAIVPYAEGDFGNISIGATGGITARIGWNIPKDFGMSTISTGSETGISTYNQRQNRLNKKWSFAFNFNISGSAVARDIFLDGNTFVDSHSVDKRYFIASGGFGFTSRYKNYSLDYYYQKQTKHYDSEKLKHGYGSVILSFAF
jgi:hypothetical protein